MQVDMEHSPHRSSFSNGPLLQFQIYGTNQHGISAALTELQQYTRDRLSLVGWSCMFRCFGSGVGLNRNGTGFGRSPQKRFSPSEDAIGCQSTTKAKCHCMSMHAFQGLRNAIRLGRKVSDIRDFVRVRCCWEAWLRETIGLISNTAAWAIVLMKGI